MFAENTVFWTEANHASHLMPARELSRFKLGDKHVDIRRWPVFTSDGRLVVRSIGS